MKNTDYTSKEEENYQRKKCKEETVIITDSFRTMMAVSDRKKTKNPKTQTLRKLMD
jgi:archaellum biogenesis ATPase FlaH